VSQTSKHNPDNPLGHHAAVEVPVFQPHIGIDTVRAVTDALAAGWLGSGPLTQEFEESIARYLALDGRSAVATNTGTSALHLALLVAGVGAGDEVLVPAFNFVADHQAITATGAQPVFCDVREDNLGIDCESAERLVSPRTKAVIPLHFAGIPCDIDGVYALAARHDLRVIEDATHAFGTVHGGRRIGSRGDLTCFSFDPVKVVTCVDGGAVITGNPSEVERLQQMRQLGIDRDAAPVYRNPRAWDYDIVSIGFRYHLSDIHASIGLSQLRRVDEFVANRRAYCRLYSDCLRGVDGIVTPPFDSTEAAPFIYYVRVLNGGRKEMMARLRQDGIATGIHFTPVHTKTLYSASRAGDLSVTERVGEEVMTLPLHSFMREDVVRRIAGIVADFARTGR
jgi:dTDP-4-amino-4,6-dideoxygalactose transaminase